MIDFKGNQFERDIILWACAGVRGNSHGGINHSNRLVRTRMPGGVGGDRSAMIGPYPDRDPRGGLGLLVRWVLPKLVGKLSQDRNANELPDEPLMM
jgi:hypothetical protein